MSNDIDTAITFTWRFERQVTSVTEKIFFGETMTRTSCSLLSSEDSVPRFCNWSSSFLGEFIVSVMTEAKLILKKNIFIFAYIYHHDKMLLPTVNHLIFPRMLMCASLKLAKPAPHSLVLARMEACVVIIVILIELDAWCDTCDDFHQPHKSPTSSSASFDDQLWSQTPL